MTWSCLSHINTKNDHFRYPGVYLSTKNCFKTFEEVLINFQAKKKSETLLC